MNTIFIMQNNCWDDIHPYHDMGNFWDDVMDLSVMVWVMQTNIHSGLLLAMGITCLTRQFVLGSFFDVFLGDFRSTWGRQERIIWDPVFFSDFRMSKMLFSWNSKVKHHSFSEISPSARFCALPFWGRPAPPAAAWEICQIKPRSDHTSRLQYLQFSEACHPISITSGHLPETFPASQSSTTFPTFSAPGSPGPPGSSLAADLWPSNSTAVEPQTPGSRAECPEFVRLVDEKTGDFWGKLMSVGSFQRGNWCHGFRFLGNHMKSWEWNWKKNPKNQKHLVFFGSTCKKNPSTLFHHDWTTDSGLAESDHRIMPRRPKGQLIIDKPLIVATMGSTGPPSGRIHENPWRNCWGRSWRCW